MLTARDLHMHTPSLKWMMIKVEAFLIVRDNYSAQGFYLRAGGPIKISPGRFFATKHLFYFGLGVFNFYIFSKISLNL